MTELRIGGFTPLTTIDYPGQISAVVFCQGCPWHCDYCHNPQLIPAKPDAAITWKDISEFMKKRRGLLDAVVFSGGEPTLQAALEPAMHELHDQGFKIGLHTAGMYPERLQKVLQWLDWVGMDIKAPFAKYEKISGVPGSGEMALSSAQLLIESGVKLEFRTTWHPQLLDYADLCMLSAELKQLGATHYAIQTFRSAGCSNQALNSTSHIAPELLRMAEQHIAPQFEQFNLRTA